MELARFGRLSGPEGAADLSTVHPESKLLRELTLLTNSASYDTTYLTHGIHSYSAKYIPQIPRRILQEHTNERHYVFDPFCGSGTTLVEAAILGRKSVGVDSHPIAALISRAKTSALNRNELTLVDEFCRDLERMKPAESVPARHRGDKQLRHWFTDTAIAELEQIRQRIAKVRSDNAREFLQCVYSSIIVSVSKQESETRYAAVEKDVAPGDVARRLLQKLLKARDGIAAFSEVPQAIRNRPRVINYDIRAIGEKQIQSESIDLVVTSPPYPNSYDYYLYHKWRMWWLGMDYAVAKAAEIGSRNEHSSRRAPIESYVTKMRAAFGTVARVLKPSKLAYVLVGDAVIRGKFYNLREVFEDITRGSELELIDAADYSLAKVSRSFNEKRSDGCHGGTKHPDKRQHVLVLRRVRAIRPSPKGRAQATPLAKSEVGELEGVLSGTTIALRSSDDRHIHALGRYPSKFIPEIPRWAIESFSKRGDYVLDPFIGSGTTAIESVIAGRNAVALDVSPYACLLTRAKTSRIGKAALAKSSELFASVLEHPRKLSNARAPSFELADFWFPKGNLEQLAALSQFVHDDLPENCRDFYLAVLSTAVRPSSYQDEGQIKVKRDPFKVARGVPQPVQILRNSFPKHLVRLREFLTLRDPDAKCRVVRRSAASILDRAVKPGTVDLVVTSPPYINAMNYPMTHRYENFVLELIEPDEKRAHEREYFGSERVYAADYRIFKSLELEFDRAQELGSVLKRIHEQEPKRSYIARSYFMGMAQAVSQIHEALKPGGRFVLVLGRNTIRGVSVDTFEFVLSQCEAAGFEVEKWFKYEIIKNAFKLTRHKTADIIPLDGVAVMRKR